MSKNNFSITIFIAVEGNGQMAGSFKGGYEHSGSVKFGAFLD
jgi:hypothetical protein